MYIEISGVRVHIGFPAAAVLAFLINGGRGEALLFFLPAAAVHELTHLFFMRKYGCRTAEAEISPGGIRISADGFETLGYKRAAVCLLSAPAVNLLLAAAGFVVFRATGYEIAKNAASVNLALGLINLLPMSFLDGGRAFSALAGYYRDGGTERMQQITDTVCLIVAGTIGVYCAVLPGHNFSPVVFSLYCAFMTAIKHAAEKKD